MNASERRRRVKVCWSTLTCAVLKVRGGGASQAERTRSESEESEAKWTRSEGERPEGKFPVTIAGGHHLYPYRTQKLSLQTLMVLSWERLGRVGSCRDPQGAGGTEVFPALEHKEERGSERKLGEARCEAEAGKRAANRPRMILSSSMAEHSAVNRRVVGSSPTWGASFSPVL